MCWLNLSFFQPEREVKKHSSFGDFETKRRQNDTASLMSLIRLLYKKPPGNTESLKF